jgi:hypothetical protein
MISQVNNFIDNRKQPKNDQKNVEVVTNSETVVNPMIDSTVVGTPGQEMAPKNISQENIVPESNIIQPKESLSEQQIKQRTTETSRPEDVANPMLSSTVVGAPGKPMSPKNISQSNFVPMPSAEYLRSKAIPPVAKVKNTEQSASYNDVVSPLQQQQDTAIQNKSGGYKNKTLKKREQNIKIRLV